MTLAVASVLLALLNLTQGHTHRRTPPRGMARRSRGSAPMELVRPGDLGTGQSAIPAADAPLRARLRQRVADGTTTEHRIGQSDAWTYARRAASDAADDRVSACARYRGGLKAAFRRTPTSPETRPSSRPPIPCVDFEA